MEFVSINELDCFQFHDAEITEIKLINNRMLWKVSAINTMMTNTQNNNLKNMCIESALMTFEDILIEKLEFWAYKTYDSSNNLIKSVAATCAMPEEYEEILSKSTSSYCYIYSMNELLNIADKKYRVSFDIDGGAGDYCLTFTFSRSTVEWNNFSGEAWYEHPKWKSKKN